MACPNNLTMTAVIIFLVVSTAGVVEGESFGKKASSRKTLIGLELKSPGSQKCQHKYCGNKIDPNSFCKNLENFDVPCGNCGPSFTCLELDQSDTSILESESESESDESESKSDESESESDESDDS